jgi:hypothetical protein
MKQSKVKSYLNTKSMNDDIQKHERDGWEVVSVNTTASPVIDYNYEYEWTLLYQRDADQAHSDPARNYARTRYKDALRDAQKALERAQRILEAHSESEKTE